MTVWNGRSLGECKRVDGFRARFCSLDLSAARELKELNGYSASYWNGGNRSLNDSAWGRRSLTDISIRSRRLFSLWCSNCC